MQLVAGKALNPYRYNQRCQVTIVHPSGVHTIHKAGNVEWIGVPPDHTSVGYALLVKWKSKDLD